MSRSILRGVVAVALAGLVATVVAAQSTTKTLTLSGTVLDVNEGMLIVKMDSGEIRTFTPAADRVFVIDGKEVKLNDLQPGTKLKATYTETATTVTDRTVDTLQGTVVYAAGPTVILKLPSGERKQYFVKHTDPVKFHDQDGKEMTVFDLRENMVITATKITEMPRVEIAANTTVTGTAPAMAAARSEAPVRAAAPVMAAGESEKPKKLPKTGSPLPVLGLIGIVASAIGLALTGRRRGIW